MTILLFRKQRWPHSLTRVFILAFVLILLLAIALPALADYLGPDRTRTESDVETYDWGVWAKPDPTGNSCNHTYGTDCVVCIWERHPGSPCGDATYWYKVGTRSEVVERTVTYPEAVISASLDGCALRNGWCSASPRSRSPLPPPTLRRVPAWKPSPTP